jgi:hypothetical protein
VTKIDERVQALEAKLKQLKVVQQRKEARARTVVARRTRHDDLRRKVLVGAIVLAKVDAKEIDAALFKQWLASGLTRPEDKALFELDTQ